MNFITPQNTLRGLFVALSLLLVSGLYSQDAQRNANSESQAGIKPMETTLLASPLGVIHTIPDPGKSLDLTWDGDYIWVADDLTKKIRKLDPVDGEVLETFNYPESILFCEGITFEGQDLWVCGWETPTGDGSKFVKINRITGVPLTSFDYPGGYYDNWPHGITYAGSFIWANNSKTQTLDKINPGTGELVGTLPVASDHSVGIAWDGQSIWTSDYMAKRIYKQNASSGDVMGSFQAPAVNCRGMEWDENYLWTVSYEEGTIFQMEVTELSVEEEDLAAFKLYPNPGHGTFHIEINHTGSAPLTIILVDMWGRTVKRISEEKILPGMNFLSVDLSDLPAGIYSVKAGNERSSLATKIIVTL